MHSGSGGSRALFAVLVLPTIFIAVMVLQLRYLEPWSHSSRTSKDGHNQLDFGVAWLLIRKLFSINTNGPEREYYLDIDNETVKEKDGRGSRRGTRRRMEDDEGESGVEFGDEGEESVRKKQQFNVYHALSCLLIKLRYSIVCLWDLFWRASVLHAHKMVMLCLFILALYEISLSYFVLVCFIFLATPLLIFNRISSPIVTLYLGVLAVAKLLFQLLVVGGAAVICAM